VRRAPIPDGEIVAVDRFRKARFLKHVRPALSSKDWADDPVADITRDNVVVMYRKTQTQRGPAGSLEATRRG
jgi:hypothetical protein